MKMSNKTTDGKLRQIAQLKVSTFENNSESSPKIKKKKFLKKNFFKLPVQVEKDDVLYFYKLQAISLHLRVYLAEEKKLRWSKCIHKIEFFYDMGIINILEWEKILDLNKNNKFKSARSQFSTYRQLRSEINSQIQDFLNEIDGHISNVESKNLNELKDWLKIKLKIDKDIYISLLIESDYFPREFDFADNFTCDAHGRSKILSSLYTKKTIYEHLDPNALLFVENLIDVNWEKMRGENWYEVPLCLSESFYGNSRDSFWYSFSKKPFEIINPEHTMDDVILPDEVKQHITSLCSLLNDGIFKRTLFLFKGDPGTGKTMTAHAIAHFLSRKILKLSLSSVPRSINPYLIKFFAERARRENMLLFFDECEDFISRNSYLGLTDSWVKLYFEKYEGVAVFATNSELDPAIERRMTYVAQFSSPSEEIRFKVMNQELEQLQVNYGILEVPSDLEMRDISRKYQIPGGYIAQALQLGAALSKDRKLEKKALEEAVGHVEKTIDKKSSFDISEPKVVFSDVILKPDTLEIVEEFVKLSHVYHNNGNIKNITSGITALFTGPSGTGKTMTAEAIAHRLGLKFLRATASTFLSAYVGETERNIAKIFKATESQKVLLFIDEAEGLLARREDSNRSWETTKTNEFLNRIEKFKGILIAATNNHKMIDSAFSRRFNFLITFSIPDRDTRRKIWKPYIKTLGMNFSDIAEISDRYELSGAEIKNIALRCLAKKELSLKIFEQLCVETLEARIGQTSRLIGIESGLRKL
jgi:SpoVK/Ycf46/Vps4 family AAA+-type ATPase